MKKLFSIILILFSFVVQAQNLKTTVDNSLLNQGTKGITALKLRNTLNTIVDSVRLNTLSISAIQTAKENKLPISTNTERSYLIEDYAVASTPGGRNGEPPTTTVVRTKDWITATQLRADLNAKPTIGYFQNISSLNPGFYSGYDYVYDIGDSFTGKLLYKFVAGSGFLQDRIDQIGENIIPESSNIDKLLQTQINSKLEITAAANYANLSSNNVFTGSNRFLNPIFVNSTSSSQYSSITGVWSNTERNGIFSFRYNTPFGSNTVTWDPIRMNVNGQVGIGMNPTESFEVLGGAKFNSGISATNLAASGSVAANSLTSSTLRVTGLSVFADNTAAKAGGLTAGAHYRTATGVVMVVF